MKREFTPFDNSQGNEQPQPEQTPMSPVWPRSPVNAQPDIPNGSAAQPQQGPPPQAPRRPAGSGLLSNWKSAQLQQGQQSQQPAPAPGIIAPPLPLRPQGPVTDPSHNQQNVQSLMAAPISPHQSGINSIPSLFNGQNGSNGSYGSNGANGQPVNPQQGQNIQNAPPFQQSQRPGPNIQNAPPFTSQQPVNGQTASPFNPNPSPFASEQQRQPYQYPGSPPPGQPNQPNQSNQPFGPQPVPGQPQNPWQLGQMRQMGPVGPTNGGIPPGMVRPGGNGQGGGQGGQGGNGSKKISRKKKRRFPIWARVVVAMLVVLIIVISTGVIYYQLNFAAPVANITNQQVSRINGEENPNANRDPNNILSGGRLNILLLGSDTDQKFAGVFLAQTDIVVTVDPATGSVAMLSIPRDTWLHAAQSNGADNGMMKLDQAYGRGGIANTRATIEQDFGIQINYYAWVGLDGFIKVIDTVGGIDVDVQHPITDDNYPDDVGNKDAYAYKRLDLAPGPQHLDGPTALEYVRSRHADLVGDFGRSVRQQQILSQLKTKLQNPGIISQLPTLANDLNGYVKTDMALPQVLQLMNFARTINQSTIKQVVLDGSYSRTVAAYQTSYGPQDIVVLNCGTVQPLISQLFAMGSKAQCNTGISYNGTPQQVASISQPLAQATTAPAPTISTVNTTDIWQTLSQMASLSRLSMNDGSSNLFGLHSLLDLLCFVTFESPIGLQV
ncbi:MAG: LCP family protein [Ktedonobacteraceae bacterium]